MIKMKVVDMKREHFVVFFDKPGRIEVNLLSGHIMAEVYSGVRENLEQQPLLSFDGFDGGRNDKVRGFSK